MSETMHDGSSEMLVHGHQAHTDLTLVSTRCDGVDYRAAVEAILAQFRAQAEQMVHAQLEQQTLNRDDVLAIFPGVWLR